jgi:hypothetical protein
MASLSNCSNVAPLPLGIALAELVRKAGRLLADGPFGVERDEPRAQPLERLGLDGKAGIEVERPEH